MEAFNAGTGAELWQSQIPWVNNPAVSGIGNIAVDSVTHDLLISYGAELYELAGDTGGILAQVPVPYVITSLAVDSAARVALISENRTGTGLAKVDLSTFTVVATTTQGGVDNLVVDHGTGQFFAQIAPYPGGPLSLGVFSESTLGQVATPVTGIQNFVVDSVRGFVDVANANQTALYEVGISSGTVARTLNMATGTIFNPSALDSVTGTVFDTGQQYSDGLIRVVGHPLVITSAAPSQGATWTDYSFPLSSSPAGVYWTVTSGTLPPGLSLDKSTGVLSGTPTTVGSYTYTVTGRDATGAGASATYTQVIRLNRVIDQVYGPDRYQTSVEVAQQGFPDGASIVFVADGNTFPDALSAGPAATKLGGPVLLTAPDALPAAVAGEVSALAPSKVVIVGGTGAVSNGVQAQLTKLVPNTVRWSGSDRYATSRAIVSNAFGSNIPDVFVATGTNFPDALAAGAAAGAVGAPILLVNGSAGALDSATSRFLLGTGVTYAYIAGGTGAVSAGVANGIWLSVTGDVGRFAGSDRYQTAEQINEAVWNTNGKNTSQPTSNLAFLVTGLNFPDALSAGPLAGGTNAPMYLVPPTCVPNAVISDLNGLGASFVVLVGGPGVLPQPIADLKPCNPAPAATADAFGPAVPPQSAPDVNVDGHPQDPRRPSVEHLIPHTLP